MSSEQFPPYPFPLGPMDRYWLLFQSVKYRRHLEDTHTIPDLDLHARVALRDIFHASNNLRHVCDGVFSDDRTARLLYVFGLRVEDSMLSPNHFDRRWDRGS